MARPPHLFIDDSIYFITCRTKDGVRFFNSDRKKCLIKKSINKACEKYSYKIFAWVILDNHYHLLIGISDSIKLPNFIQYINGASSRWLRQLEKKTGDRLLVRPSRRQTDSLPSTWNNYWDRCIRDEKDFWIHFNYIHQNPVKHRYSKTMNSYKFSSYDYYLSNKGQSWLDSVFFDYPVINYHV